MNSLPGKILQIHQSGEIQLIDVDVEGTLFSALLIDSAKETNNRLQAQKPVYIIFKETEVTLAFEPLCIISTRNRLLCSIVSINKGAVLSTVVLKWGIHTLVSAVTSRAVDSMAIKPGMSIIALIKSNEISLRIDN